MIPMTGSSFSSPLETCLSKLGIPQPLYKYFSDYKCLAGVPVPMLYAKVVGSLERADSIVMALDLLFSRQLCTNYNPTLAEYDCLFLLQHLSKNLQQWERVPNAIETVQKLPVFCTVYRKLVSIHGSCAYIIPNKIPVTDMESWTSTRSVIFLRSEESIHKLLLLLGCKEQTEVEVYCGFIFKHFELLTDKGKLVHLKYVRDHLLPGLKPKVSKLDHDKKKNERMLDALLESLGNLEFIPNSAGTMACACTFYDPTVDVFKAMLSEAHFPSKPFYGHEWLGFLIECGMKSVVTQTMFLQYARQVAGIGQREISDDLLVKSKVLVSHLFSRDDLFVNSFLQQVRENHFHCSSQCWFTQRTAASAIRQNELLTTTVYNSSHLPAQLSMDLMIACGQYRRYFQPGLIRLHTIMVNTSGIVRGIFWLSCKFTNSRNFQKWRNTLTSCAESWHPV